MRRLILAAVLFVMVGCGSNPAGSLPPIVSAPSFEQQIDTLDTPEKTAMWLEAEAKYDLNYNNGWGDAVPDQAYTLAKSLWNEKHGGKHRGVCGQHAAFFIVAARAHGYQCGAMHIWTSTNGHTQGWIIGKDGTVGITDNERYIPGVFKSFEDFIVSSRARFAASQETSGQIVDSQFNIQEDMP